MLSFSSRSASTRRSISRRSRCSARSFGSDGSPSSPASPSDSTAATLPSAPVGEGLGASLLVAVVVEHRMLGGEQPLALVGARHLGLRKLKRLEHADALVLVRVGGRRFSASTKKPPNSVVYCSAPLRVAVTIVRPGPDSASRNGPLELAVLTKTICLASEASSAAR